MSKHVWQFFDLNTILARQRGGLFPWCAVLFGGGVGIYFVLSREPSSGALTGLALGFLLLLIGAWRSSEHLSPFFGGAAWVIAGVLVAALHAHAARAPVLGFRYYGPVEGTVIAVDRSHGGKIRMMLDQVVLRNMSPDRTPDRVRISLHGDSDPDAPPAYDGFVPLIPEIGQNLVLTAHLSPPPGPAEPGGFDFRRYAWFQKLGAIGYTRTPVLQIRPPETTGFWLRVNRLRGGMSALIRRNIKGEAGAFAVAITTGDRSAMSQVTTTALRGSNLSHLLAISGLHMGLLTGVVFTGLRWFLVLVPGVGLHWPVRKLAAVGAMMTGAVYLALSGGNVATVRAFIMVSVLFIAVLLGRRALTLNAVALAAIVVLFISPEALVGPGFQMSFAATTALVVVFGNLKGTAASSRIPRALRGAFAVVASSFIAGAATAPVAAAHFNQVAQYGLLANVLSVPVMGAVVVPAGVVALLLEPFGLGWIGFWVMEWGIRWILAVADFVSHLEGAVWKVPTPQWFVLPLIAVGGLWFVLWRGKLNRAGIPIMLSGVFLWAQIERPVLLIAESGRLIGVMTPQGRALSKPRGDGFAARNWLENDGDAVSQADAAARPGFDRSEGGHAVVLVGTQFVLLAGRGARDRIVPMCRDDNWLIYGGKIQGLPAVEGCNLLTERRLRKTGSIAVFYDRNSPTGIRTVTSSDLAGDRLWLRRQ